MGYPNGARIIHLPRQGGVLSAILSYVFYLVHSGNTIECCEPGGYNLSPRYIHPFCVPIAVPLDDRYYSKHNVECMPYVRSIAAIRSDCSFGPIEQVSIIHKPTGF